MNLKQVRLRRGTSEQIAWIDEKAAVVGNSVELIEDNLFWTVSEVSPFVISEKYLKEKQRMDKHQRKGSDI